MNAVAKVTTTAGHLLDGAPAARGDLTDESSTLSPNEVNVVVTTTKKHTLAALQAAGTLARNLHARLNILCAHVVHYLLPIEKPSVSIDFMEGELLDLAFQGASGHEEIGVQLYLCRDRRQALLRALKPKSLVVMGSRRSWWPTREKKLARLLRLSGHHVILVGAK